MPVLFTLQHFEIEEDYEECYKIMEALKIHEKFLKIKLLTRITKENIEKIIEESQRLNLDGRAIVKDAKFCSMLIISEIYEKPKIRKID